MILHVVAARRCGPFSLDVRFNDGVRKRVNLYRALTGPVFRPLRSRQFFEQWKLDRVMGVIFWPNGADFAPEFLHDLPEERSRLRRASRPRGGSRARAASRR
jgi:hypothetical protein